MIKRLFDIIAAVVGLVLLGPLILIVAILIKIDSKGSIFFLQDRVGLNGHLFKIVKFRTMYANDGLHITVGNLRDDRITSIGRGLRRYHLDELPQLLNVLVGDMSIVGPRPHIESITKHHRKLWHEVWKVKPGITGFAAVFHSRHEYKILNTSNDPEADFINKVLPTKLRLEKYYVRHQSFCFDLYLIMKTLAIFFKSH